MKLNSISLKPYKSYKTLNRRFPLTLNRQVMQRCKKKCFEVLLQQGPIPQARNPMNPISPKLRKPSPLNYRSPTRPYNKLPGTPTTPRMPGRTHATHIARSPTALFAPRIRFFGFGVLEEFYGLGRMLGVGVFGAPGFYGFRFCTWDSDCGFRFLVLGVSMVEGLGLRA